MGGLSFLAESFFPLCRTLNPSPLMGEVREEVKKEGVKRRKRNTQENIISAAPASITTLPKSLSLRPNSLKMTLP